MSDNMQVAGEAAVVYCLICKAYEVMEGATVNESWVNANLIIKAHLKAVGHTGNEAVYRDLGRLKEDENLSLGVLKRESSR